MPRLGKRAFLSILGAVVSIAQPAGAGPRVSPLPERGCFGAATELFAGEQARECPAGKTIVFARGTPKDHDLYTRDLASGAETQLTSGKADDVDPDFYPDCSRVVFASNRNGSYDLYVIDLTRGSTVPERLTSLKGDERNPSVSPLPFRLAGLHPYSCGGPWDQTVLEYHKVLFTHFEGKKRSVRFVSDDGTLGDVVRRDCDEASWGADGLTAFFRCGNAVTVERAKVLTPGSAIDAAGGEEAVSKVMKGLTGGEHQFDYVDPDESEGKMDNVLADKRRPRLYLSFAPPLFSGDASGARDLAGSVNQLVLVGQRPVDGRSVLTASAAAGPAAGKWVDVPGVDLGKDASWAADGRSILFTCGTQAAPSVCRAPTTCPLQEVVDLLAYPSLWQRGLPASLAGNGFVAMTSPEKEFFHIYEKARYEGQGILITPDSVLSAFSDVFARALQARELTLAASLQAFAVASSDWANEQRGSKPDDPTVRYLSVLFGVPRVLLVASENLAPATVEPFYDPSAEEEEGQEAEAAETAEELFKSSLDTALFELPADVADDVRGALDMLAAGEIRQLVKGDFGLWRDLMVDFSMARPRSHYTGPRYSQYFQSLTWLGLMPLPVNDQTVAYASWLLETVAASPAKAADPSDEQSPDPGDEQGADADDEQSADADDEQSADAGDEQSPDPGPEASWRTVFDASGALAGPPAVPGFDLLLEVAASGKTRDAEEVAAEIVKRFGPVKVRTLEDAVGKKEGVQVALFPKRLGPDAEVFKSTTHPDVEGRPFPQAIDLFAALGMDWLVILLESVKDQPFDVEAWQLAAGNWRSEFTRRGEGYFGATLYNRWVQLLYTLAAGYDVTAAPAFVKSDAYRYRLLMAGLAGFAQLKHHTVLYSFQNYGVECDASSPIVLFYEKPVLPPPPVYIEPHLAFYEGLAALVREAGKVFGLEVKPLNPVPAGCEDRPFSLACDWYLPEGEPRCPSLCTLGDYSDRSTLQVLGWTAEVLAAACRKQMEGTPLADWEYSLLYTFGGVLEQLFLGNTMMDSGQRGADQGRMARGIAMVTDVYTNVQRGLVLHEAVGRPMDLFATAQFAGATHVVRGAMLSWYEFTDPKRLTDDEWWERLSAPGADRSLLPAWADKFVE